MDTPQVRISIEKASERDDLEYENGWKEDIPIWKKLITVLAITSALAYECWRYYDLTTQPSTLWLSIPFIIFESFVILFGSVTNYMFALSRKERPQLRLRNTTISPENYPTVDVMIPTYSEPTELVRDTLLAVINMDYDHSKMTVSILDDGKSEEKKVMVEQIAVSITSPITIRYIAREKQAGVPHHAKAGNINNALLNENTTGELVVIFDCDMICDPEFLQAVVPHFYKANGERDMECSMIQTPQAFSNIPERDPFAQNYSILFGPAMKCWDAANATPCVGTNVVFSRKHLMSLDQPGVQYGSITEDILTSLMLQNGGNKTKYVGEILATGLAPETYSDFFKQRFRWAAGGLQVFMTQNAMLKRGLSFRQKVLYFYYTGVTFLMSVPITVMLLMSPSIIFLKMINPNINNGAFSASGYLAFAIPMVVLNMLNLFVAFHEAGYRFVLRSIQETAFMVPCHLTAVMSVMFCRPLKFNVTPKEKMAQLIQEFKYIIPNVIYFIYSCAAVVCAIVMISGGYSSRFTQDFTLFIPVAWTLFMTWQMFPPIGSFIRLMFQCNSKETPATTNSHVKEIEDNVSLEHPQQEIV